LASRKYFAIYAETCFASFGDRVKTWITINEPLQTAVNGYDMGEFAPGRRQNSSIEPYLAAHHQILAHAAAVSIYRSKYKVYCSIQYY
jgi:beta-glucosidase